MSYLVANPEDRFCRDVKHLLYENITFSRNNLERDVKTVCTFLLKEVSLIYLESKDGNDLKYNSADLP